MVDLPAPDPHPPDPQVMGNRSLADDLRSGPLHHGEVVWIGRCIADQLDRSHRVDVVRGIVRPEDILWTGADRPLLARFVSRSGDWHGEFLAPEMWAGAAPTIAADVYSLGATLCVALGGKPVVLDEDGVRCLSADDVPMALIEVLEKATARWPIDRYFTAAAFRDALDASLVARERSRAARATKVLAFAAAIIVIGWLGIMVAGARVGGSFFDGPTASASVAGAADVPSRIDPPRGPASERAPVAGATGLAAAEVTPSRVTSSPPAPPRAAPTPSPSPASGSTPAPSSGPVAGVPATPVVARSDEPTEAKGKAEEAHTAKVAKVTPSTADAKPTKSEKAAAKVEKDDSDSGGPEES